MLLRAISSRNSSLQKPRILAVFNVQSSYNARRTQVQLLVDSCFTCVLLFFDLCTCVFLTDSNAGTTDRVSRSAIQTFRQILSTLSAFRMSINSSLAAGPKLTNLSRTERRVSFPPIASVDVLPGFAQSAVLTVLATVYIVHAHHAASPPTRCKIDKYSSKEFLQDLPSRTLHRSNSTNSSVQSTYSSSVCCRNSLFAPMIQFCRT
jgi:hypothetical protein